MESFIPQTTAALLRRCHASAMRAADLIENDEPVLAVETLHHIATDIEHLIERLAEPTS